MVAIIIPIYNVENYLGECIESVLNQSYNDILLVLVNDGSSDHSLEVARGYLNDSRVVVIDKRNGGCSSARNAGLNFIFEDYLDAHSIEYTVPSKNDPSILQSVKTYSAKNNNHPKLHRIEWIMFVDSDDILDTNAISVLLNAMQENSTQFACGGSQVFDESGVLYRSAPNAIARMNSIDYLRGIRGYFAKANYYLVRSEILRNLRFINGIINEDLPFGIDLFMCDFDMSVVPDTIFYKRHRSGSISYPDTFNNNGYNRIKYTFNVISSYLLRLYESTDDKNLREFFKWLIDYNVNGMMIYHILTNDKNKPLFYKFAEFIRLKHHIWITNSQIYFIMRYMKRLTLKLRKG